MKQSQSSPVADWIGVGIVVAITLASLYLGIAWAAFQWRNPKANQMAFYRDFGAMVQWKRLERYQ